MFVAPAWAFADAYSAHAPTHVYRFDHTTWTLRALGLGATHGSEIVHIQHSYSSYLGRKLHPLGRRVQPAVGRRMQRTWLAFATKGWERGESWSDDWPLYRHRTATDPRHPVGPRRLRRRPRRGAPKGVGRPALTTTVDGTRNRQWRRNR